MTVVDTLNAALAGHYQVERELGRGGMATVYLARDERHDRRVAIKVLHPELSAVLGAERFLAEIKLTAALQHPHILPLFDSGSTDGLLFYVMPFVEGETLRARLSRETQLPVDAAVRIAREVASALDYAHRRGVIHRDIKPENILLHDGSALVADFGIALAVQHAGGQRMTQTGLSLGTPQYMSPEQAMGEREITPRSDVYALGAVTYEMLAGEAPFVGASAQAIVARVMTEEPRALASQRKTVPPAVDEAVRRALQKLPADRFGSAAEFAAALDARGTAAAAAVGPTPRPRTRARVGPLALAGVALAALAAGAVSARLLARPGDASVRYTQKTFGDEAVSLARWAPDGMTLVFSAGPFGQAPALYVVRPDYPEPEPLGVGPAHLLSVSSRGELAVLMRPSLASPNVYQGTLARMPLGGGAPRELMDDVRAADWSPDGSQLAVIRTVAGKDRLELLNGKVLVETTGWLSDPRWAPDGRSIAFEQHPFRYETRGSVDVVDLEGHRRSLTASVVFSGIAGLAWSRGGDELLFSAAVPGVHQLVVLGVTLGGRMRQALNGPGDLTIEDVAADGRWLVSRDIDAYRLFLHTATDTALRSVGWMDHAFAPVISGDGRLLAFSDASTESGMNYSVYLRATAGGKAARLGDGWPLAFSHDGRWLLAALPTRPLRLMLYPTGAGTERVVPTNGVQAILFAAWGPGDSTTWYCGKATTGASACWERVRGSDAARVRPYGMPSPDGRWIVTWGAGRYTLLTTGGDTVRAVPGLRPGDALLRWSPDGHAIWVLGAGLKAADAVDVATGVRTPLPVRFDRDDGGSFGWHALSDDPRQYAYVGIGGTSHLFAVEGVR